MLKAAIIGTAIFTATLGAGNAVVSGDIREILAGLGVTAVLAWFLYYTIRYKDPATEKRHADEKRERDLKFQETIKDMKDAFAATLAVSNQGFERMLGEQRRDFLSTLDKISRRNRSERRQVRQLLSDVAEGEKLHAAGILRLSHSIDRQERDLQEKARGIVNDHGHQP